MEVAGSKTLLTLKRAKRQRTNFDKVLRNNVYVMFTLPEVLPPKYPDYPDWNII